MTGSYKWKSYINMWYTDKDHVKYITGSYRQKLYKYVI